MLARSMASRHGDGRTCANATSMIAEVAVLDHQVGRLDVAVGQPGLPQAAHEREALVDDLVVDVGVADLDGPVEELGDEEVLALGRQLDDPERGGRRQAGVAHDPQGVVLVLDEPAHRLERRLVLEAPVEDRPARLVPAVRADVVHRVELPEHVRVRIAGERESQRCRAARAGEADGLDVDDGDPELRLDGGAERRPAASADVEVGGLAAAVA